MLKRQIESLIRDHGEKGSFLLEPLLKALSHIFGTFSAMVNRRYDQGGKPVRTLPRPVISVGNITVGGTGKTPMTVYLARGLQERGYAPMILSRGYGGNLSKKSGLVSDGTTVFLDSRKAGDEPSMMAHELPGVPVVVGRNRFDAAMNALNKFSPDVILLDDGFQHRALSRDLDIVLLDASDPLGNGYHLPRGPLREPVSGLKRAHMFVLTRSGGLKDCDGTFNRLLCSLNLPDTLLRTPVALSDHRPVIRRVVRAGALKGDDSSASSLCETPQKAFAFSGIAHNRHFRDSLSGLGFSVTGFMEYSDHHPYNPKDIETIVQKAGDNKESVLVTTEKDASRLEHLFPFPVDLWVIGIDLNVLSGESLLWDMILERMCRR